MATAGSIVVDLLMRTGAFETDTKRAEKRLQDFQKRATQVGKAIGAAFAVGAGVIAIQLKNTIDRMDDLTKAAARASLPVEEFTKLAHAGSLADVAVQDLQSAMGRLAKAQGDAEKATSQQGRIFEALGIAVKDAGGNLRSTYDVFMDFAEAFQQNQGSPEIMAAGMAIFGRSFQTLIPLLKDGAAGIQAAGDEAERLGLVFDQEAGAAAEKFNDDLARLKGAFAGIFTEMAQKLLPALSETTDRLQQLAKDGDLASNAVTVISAAMRAGVGIIEAYNNAVARTSIAIETVANSAGGLGEIMRNLGPGGLFNEGSVRDGMASVAKAFEDGQKQLDALISQQNNPFRNVISGASTVGPNTGGTTNLPALRRALGDAPKAGGGGKSDEQREAEQLQKSYESLMETMRERIALFNTEGEAAKVRYDLEHGALKMLDEASKQALITEAERYDLLVKRREADQAAYDLAKEETDRIQQGLKDGKAMLADLEFELELMRMTNAERATAIQLRGLESEAVTEYGEAIAEMNRRIEEELERVQFMDNLRGEFSDFIVEVVSGTATITDAFKSMLDNINQMILQRIADQWVEQLFGGFGTNQTGSSGGWLGTLANIFAGSKAGGGDVMGRRAYLVGEQGPEMFVPRTAGTILTAPQTADAMGGAKRGMVVNQNFINPVLADRRSDTQREAEAARRLRRVQRYA